MRLPSLPALRAFESAARLGSFRAAAQTLHLSPTAISHHIRGLETQLGIALFIRESRRVRLTEAGRLLAESATEAFGQLEVTLDTLSKSARRLTISTTPAFATLWLAPRLDDFQRRHPELEVTLLSSTQRIDMRRDRHVDLALRYAPTETSIVGGRQLMQESIAAFASPEYAARLTTASEAELITTRWESERLAPVDWTMWLAEAGEPRSSSISMYSFTHEPEVVQAGLAGRGLILVSELLVRSMIARGWLVPWRPEIRLPGYAYHALPGPLAADRPIVARFIEWLDTDMQSAGR
ncbi:LysR substrate-binding domain-containing protein [Kushneria aurantia]|uniref:LysR substrate-binding domain-containing protein n=1 Tax=Kushneria aurantia TaxID=504092 RepID=A0ABV6G0G5_9GAMM|nr:LysR substrate-binding domain-containing protein [Kushneria aurantia]